MINQIIEKYFDTWKSSYSGDATVDIWLNPSKQEMRKELNNGKYVRFIIDIKKKNVYVADANTILHEWMWNFLKINTKGLGQAIRDDDIVIGYTNSSGALGFMDNGNNLPELHKMDWKWMNKYFSDFDKDFVKFMEMFIR